MEIDWLHATPAVIALHLHCQKQASLLVWRVLRGQLTNQQVRAAIDAAPEQEREPLREWCNHYRRVAALRGGCDDAG